MPRAPTPVIDDATVALVESTHAAKVLAVTGQEGRATLVHAYACTVSADWRRLRATVERSQAAPVLSALAASGQVALVACHIQSLKSLQLKGENACAVKATAAERRAHLQQGRHQLQCRGEQSGLRAVSWPARFATGPRRGTLTTKCLG